MDRGAWQTTVHGILNSQTLLSDSAQHGTVPHCICVCLCVCVCVCITFFIHLSVDGHLGCFHTLETVEKAAMNIVYIFKLSGVFLDIYLGV